MAIPANAKARAALHNTLVPISFLLFIFTVLVPFTRRINSRRGKHSGEKLRLPRMIHVETGREIPAGLMMQWRKYGIPSVAIDGFVKLHDGGPGKKFMVERNTFYFVSPDQHWVASRHAFALGWNIYTDVADPERGYASVDAQKGIWKPSGVEPAVGTWHEGVSEVLSQITGIKTAYTSTLMEEGGIRQHTPVRAEQARPTRPARPKRRKRR